MARSQRDKGAIFLLVILLILIAVSLVLFFLLQTDTVADVLENNQLLNVLVILEDEDSDGKKRPLFTDILMYYPGTGRGALFEIPGNTGLIFKSLGRVDRIDEVYRQRGLDEYKSEVESLTGIEIPFTLVMNLRDFSALTDLLGGLKVFIPSPIDAVSGGERFLLPSGAVLLDGDKILSYARYSAADETEEDVQERMQNMMVAFLYALNRKSAFVLNKNVFPSVAKYIQTNADKDALYQLLGFVSSLDSERIDVQTISGDRRYVDGKLLLFPDWDTDLIKEVFKQTMASIVSASETALNRVYVLEILNGTLTQNLARNASGLLKSFGYDVLPVGNADRSDYQKTVVIDHIGNAEVAAAVAEIIRCTNIETDEVADDADTRADDKLMDFTIILGRDFDGRYVR